MNDSLRQYLLYVTIASVELFVSEVITMKIISTVITCMLCACLLSSATQADFGQDVCDATKPAMIGVLAITCFSKDHGVRNAVRAGEGMLIAYGAAHAIQQTCVVNSNPDFAHSFPSKRTAAAFAMAMSLSDAYPKQKWLAYTGASLVGWSTVAINGHTWTDVLAGAALGMAVGKWTVATPEGILIGRVIKF